MKEATNIAHIDHSKADTCSEKLYKERWGEDGWHQPNWNMTCWKCGFVKIVSDREFLEWQYSDFAMEGEVWK